MNLLQRESDTSRTSVPLYIFDIDGTLALVAHREHWLHDKDLPEDVRWRRFFADCVKDGPNLPVIETLRSHWRAGADILFFSGRSDEVREETLDWLVKYTPYSRRIIEGRWLLTMRPREDQQPDHELKRSWYDRLPDVDRKRLVAVYDDRKTVVDMWRSIGVPCFQVAPGDF
jgi:hypothetical protein